MEKQVTKQKRIHNDYGDTLNIQKIKGTQQIVERIQFSPEGKIREVWIEFSDESGRNIGNDGKEHVFRDEITYQYELASDFSLRRKDYERTNWSTGWGETLQEKQREAEIRNKALKYFEKRKKALLEKEA